MTASQPVNANNLIVEDSNWIKVTCQCHIFLKKICKSYERSAKVRS